MQSVCGNGVVGSDEQCDVADPHCVNCQLTPGYSCDATSCSINRYRAAFADSVKNCLDVRDFSLDGKSTLVNSFMNGVDAASPWAEWSADGATLVYPGGAPIGQATVYLYDVPGVQSENPASTFTGSQPSTAPDRAEIVARRDDGYVRYSPGNANPPSASAIGSFAIRWPKWDPAQSTRFAFLDRPTGSELGGLYVYDGVSSVTVATAGVSGYAWLSAGTMLYYVADDGAGACKLHLATVSASSVSNDAIVVTAMPCSACVIASPDGKTFAAGTSDSAIVRLLPNQTPSTSWADAASQLLAAGTVFDLAWTPDGKALAVLSNGATNAVLQVFDPIAGASVTVDAPGHYVSVRFSPKVLN